MAEEKKIIKEVRSFVKRECEKPDSHFKGAFENHFVDVVKYAKELARKEKADEEVIEIAAWLHDVGSVKGNYENHHIISAEIAEKLLNKLGYPKEKIEKVIHCILNHRGSKPGKPETKEAQILIDADAMAHFDEVDYLVKGKWYSGAKTEDESRKNVLSKLERSYNKMSQTAKEIIKPKLEKTRKELS
ncbi:MAG TPA: HD domain-containing protein [Candidatus Paceibacterota bacterium]|nr:HD domain-containing protein [Candidatus Paceibacterota bacterium]